MLCEFKRNEIFQPQNQSEKLPENLHVYLKHLLNGSTYRFSIAFHFSTFRINFVYVRLEIIVISFNLLLHNTLCGRQKGEEEKMFKYFKNTKKKSGKCWENFKRIISIVLFMCCSHYPLWLLLLRRHLKNKAKEREGESERERRKYFHESRLLQVTILLSGLHFSLSFFLSLALSLYLSPSYTLCLISTGEIRKQIFICGFINVLFCNLLSVHLQHINFYDFLVCRDRSELKFYQWNLWSFLLTVIEVTEDCVGWEGTKARHCCCYSSAPR